MNKKQKVISLIAVILIILMCLIPPWKITAGNENGYIEQPVGYALIFSPPSVEQEDEFGTSGYSIGLDVSRLVVQWVTLLFTVAALLYISREDETESDEENEFF